MENKQLEFEDLLMNKKEELIWRVIDNVISCCAITRIDGAKSITREDVVGKSREENVVLTRVAGMKGDIAKILAAVTKN